MNWKLKAALSLAIGVAMLGAVRVGFAEDKKPESLITEAQAPVAPDPKLPDLSPEEMKASGESATKSAAKLGWRIGCQAWTFNKRTLFETIDQVNALGVHYIEAYPGQVLDKTKRTRNSAGVGL